MAPNPITGTTATDSDPVLPLPPSEVFTFVNRETEDTVTASLHTAHRAVLYVCERDTSGTLDRGASIVITSGFRRGLPVGVVYRDMPRALRGEGYAQLYYEGEVPVLKMAQEDALWALEMVHVSDDLLDPDMSRQRTEALQGIIGLLEERSGPRVKRALSNATRALEREDVQERHNPMAAAMANWGLTVQLDHRFHEAVQIQERVSRSRHAILQNLLSTWGIFQAIKIEMEAMRRW